MKNITKSLLCIALFSAVSCSGFLDQTPTTSLSEKSVYSTEQAIEAQLYGCYQSLHQAALWKGTMAEFLHTASGLLIWKGQRTTDEWLEGLYFAKYSTSSAGNNNIWTQLFAGIDRCNRLIAGIHESPVTDEEFKLQEEAETRLLRAILYFTAVRIWGDVPLSTEPSTYNNSSRPRSNFSVVYKQILEDLDFAYDNMRDADGQEAVAPGKGRPNKWAAKAFASSVYLTIGSLLSSPDDNFWDNTNPERIPDFSGLKIASAADAFRLAYDTAESVITDGPYRLVPDYRTLFRWTDEGDWFLPERIFCLESTPEAGFNFNAVRMLPEYPEGSSNTVTTNNNWGRVRPSRFLVDNFIRNGGGSKGTDEYTDKIYVSTTDPRFATSFFTTFKSIKAGAEATVRCYPHAASVNTSNDKISVPYFKKYLDPSYDVTNGKADFYLMRLAEVYLISAEAAASLSGAVGDEWSGKAIARLNDIRARARRSTDGEEAVNPVDVSAGDFSNTGELVNAIMWERVCELSGEGHEWFDTHRRGATWLRDNIAVPQNSFLMDNDKMQVYRDFIYNSAKERESVFPTEVQQLRKSLVNAIPLPELTQNPKMIQNDFYWQ